MMENNSVVSGEDVVFTRHALRRMKWRRISKEHVKAALQQPDSIETTGFGRMNAYKIISGRLLKVTASHEGKVVTVITAVWKGE